MSRSECLVLMPLGTYVGGGVGFYITLLYQLLMSLPGEAKPIYLMGSSNSIHSSGEKGEIYTNCKHVWITHLHINVKIRSKKNLNRS